MQFLYSLMSLGSVLIASLAVFHPPRLRKLMIVTAPATHPEKLVPKYNREPRTAAEVNDVTPFIAVD